MITVITVIIRIIPAPVVAIHFLLRIRPHIVEYEVMKELDDMRRPEERRCENIASHDAEEPFK